MLRTWKKHRRKRCGERRNAAGSGVRKEEEIERRMGRMKIEIRLDKKGRRRKWEDVAWKQV